MKPRKAPADAGPVTTQEAPTAPRPRDAQGRELDQWGLPFSGPARAKLLVEMGMPDPNADPLAWEGVPSISEAGLLPALPPTTVTEPRTELSNDLSTETNDG